MPGVRFGVLGPVTAWRGTAPVEVGPGKCLRVLGVLLLHANQPVDREQIIEGAWGGKPPKSAVNLVQKYVGEVRRSLELDGATLQTVGTGYLLRVAPDRLDSAQFADGLVRARETKRSGDPAVARRHLAEAMTLWRGPAFDGIDTPAAATERARLEEYRLGALEDLAELDLLRGEHAPAIPELTRLTDEHPYRERARELLMTALYRSGRQGEALAVFRDVQGLLAEELGVDPGPGLQRVHAQILRADPALDLATAAGKQRPTAPLPADVPGRAAPPGELLEPAERRVVVPPRRPSSPAQPSPDDPAAAAPGPALRSLPYDLPDFTGRADEVAGCLEFVARRRNATAIVAVTGMAGVGKSALAVHLAHRCTEWFPDGQVFLDLHGHTPDREPTTSHVALHDLLRRTGVPDEALPRDTGQSSALWRSWLAGRRVLIVLDNVLNARQLGPLLPGSPGHLVLVTSRWRLPELDGADHLSLEPLSEAEARELLVRVSRRPVTHDRAAAEVVELCGRLPLAIRLAGTRLRHHDSWSATDLADLLRDHQRRPAELSAGSRSVADAFEVSYRRLTAGQRRAFRLLGLHHGPDVGVHAAAALFGCAVPEAWRVLEELAEAHLRREHTPGRYTCHDLLRGHANTILARDEPEPERMAALRRLVSHYVRALDAAGKVVDPPRFPGPRCGADGLPPLADRTQALAWWEAERPSLVAAVEAAAKAGLDGEAMQLARALAPFHSQAHHAAERRTAQHAALQAARRADDQAAQAHILVELGAAEHRLGRVAEARERYTEAIAVAGAAAVTLAEGRALARMGALHQSMGGYRQAERDMQAALATFRALEDGQRTATTLLGLANLYAQAGRYAEAQRTLDEALPEVERTGPLLRVGNANYIQGTLHLRLGRYRDGEQQLRLALERARTLRDRDGELRALLALGQVHLGRGRLPEAERLFCELVTDCAGSAGFVETMAHTSWGTVHAALGKPHEAVRLHTAALALATANGAHDLRTIVLNDLADTHWSAGSHDAAADCYRAALVLAGEVGSAAE
ncbi:AfsR/SARP family transcriptional regulator, partial [Amycolatopsis kentuckyensis]|uniref:AfsR/SARP family transcriptional regulator n=1 Tax=Amycolatopsis kentuckyensis TaxID=218823 RepID=UPI001177CBD4